MMNRSSSIKDIGNIYREMQKQKLSQVNENKASNAEVIEEAKVKAKTPKGTFPKANEKVSEPKTFKKGGPKNVKGLKKAKKNKKFSQKSKKITEGSINNSMSIFDKLYEDVMKSDDLDINTGIGMGPEGGMGAPEEISDIETDVETDETPESPKEMLQQAIDLLQKAVDAMGGEEDVDTDLEDLGVEDMDSDSEEDEVEEDEVEEAEEDETECDSEEDEEEDEESYGMKKETTDIKPVAASTGHQLQKGGLAAGNIKATTGKAKADVTDEVGIQTGKHPMDHKSELTNPSKNKVGSLKAGKSLFDQ
jgi:hypothetical protein